MLLFTLIALQQGLSAWPPHWQGRKGVGVNKNGMDAVTRILVWSSFIICLATKPVQNCLHYCGSCLSGKLGRAIAQDRLLATLLLNLSSPYRSTLSKAPILPTTTLILSSAEEGEKSIQGVKQRVNPTNHLQGWINWPSHSQFYIW